MKKFVLPIVAMLFMIACDQFQRPKKANAEETILAFMEDLKRGEMTTEQMLNEHFKRPNAFVPVYDSVFRLLRNSSNTCASPRVVSYNANDSLVNHVVSTVGVDTADVYFIICGNGPPMPFLMEDRKIRAFMTMSKGSGERWFLEL